MAKFDVLNVNGEKVDTVELSDAVFAVTPNEKVMHMAVVNFLANQRQGTQSTLTRAEVRGGGRKPWRQKGTGRARQGSTRAPQFKKGGVALGPKPRDYRYSLNKKVRLVAMRSALSAKVQDNEIIVIDGLALDQIKTKPMAALLNKVGAEGKALIVTANMDQNVYLSARNIEGKKVSFVGMMNVYEVLKYDKLVLSKDAAEKLGEVYA